MTNLKQERLAAALQLAEDGFAIVAIPEGSKIPSGIGWQEHATRDPRLIEHRLQDGQYGVLPLAGSRLLVVDVDDPRALAEFPALPHTRIVDTAKGFHVYGRLPEGVEEEDVPRTFAGGEVRVAGSGQVVGPYSRHPSGSIYTPRNGMDIRELSLDWLAALQRSHEARARSRHLAVGPDDKGWLIREPGRHDFLLSRARNLRGIGMSGRRLVDELQRLNAERCRPPKGTDEVAAIAAWVEEHIDDDPPASLLEPQAPDGVLATSGAGSLTFRTLADIDDAPAQDLLLGMLEPDGPTLLYGLGGVGKGSTGAWLCGELLALGIRPMVFDAENRPKEWARRVSGLGIDRSQIVYLQPLELPRPLLGQPLWEVAEHLGRIAAASGAGLLFVDSILPATGVGEERLRSDAQTPYLYVAALDALGMPTVSFGHPPKGQPEGEPFGSVAWVNAHRLTWNGTTAEGDGHRVRWRPRKRNERGHIAGVLLTFEYGLDGRLENVTRADDEESSRDWLLAALVGGPRSVADLAEDLVAELDTPAPGELERAKERISRQLRRMAHQGWVEKVGTRGSKVTWQLRER